MKVDWNSKYTTISLYSFIVICCSIIFYRIVWDTSVFAGKISEIISILQPFIIGGVLAYLLNFINTEKRPPTSSGITKVSYPSSVANCLSAPLLASVVA